MIPYLGLCNRQLLSLEGDEAILDWTGTLVDGAWELHFEGSGVFSSIDVDFNGDASLPTLE